MNSAAGQLVGRAIDIDSDIECHIPPDLNDVPARVYAVLKTLRSEKARYERELAEKRNAQ